MVESIKRCSGGRSEQGSREVEPVPDRAGVDQASAGLSCPPGGAGNLPVMGGRVREELEMSGGRPQPTDRFREANA